MDSALGTRWVIDRLKADTALTTLLGGTARVYRDVIPRGQAGTIAAIAVYHLRTDADRIPRPLKTGPNTQEFTPFEVKTEIVGSDNYASLETIANRVNTLLDGQVYVAVTGGEVYECVRGADYMWSEPDGDVTWAHLEINWKLRAKAS